MPESQSSVLSNAVLVVYVLISLATMVWVIKDTRRKGRPLSEIIGWAIFMTPPLFPLAIVTYLYFRKKNFFD
ncbi:hypothetical protein ACOBQJ_00525 [Pelotomaculum propionicicum]|uniref:hypothetical protein n=1 Tax=Pelotomaculum propionicicum TaxID=258475 RepID=UPI003B7B0DBC